MTVELTSEMYNANFRITDMECTRVCKDHTEGYVFGIRRNKYIPGGYEYVTWYYQERDGQYDFWWGHYFGSEEAAWKDFCKRSGNDIRAYEEVIGG